MSLTTLPTLEVHPGSEAKASVIWLHGLGASGHDFGTIPGELGLPSELPVRFVFPHAPSIPVTLNGGFVMPAWYDIVSLETRGFDAEGVARTDAHIKQLIARENERGVPTDRIVLGGFSMGGAMALYSGLRLEEKLAGVMGLSCYLLNPDSFEAEASKANSATAVLLCHGRQDPMVPPTMGEAARDRVSTPEREVRWFDYPMEHSLCAEEATDIGQWLTDVLNPDNA